MKNPLHYIQQYPHRAKQMLGITNDQFRDLLSQAEMHHKRIQDEIEQKKVRINHKGGGRKPKLVPQGGIQNSKFKIQTGIQRKRFVHLEWVVYLCRVVLEIKEEVCLCLFYLRQMPTFEVLGLQFGISKTEANNTFHYWLKI